MGAVFYDERVLVAALLGLAFQPDPAMLKRMFEEGLARREREYGLSDARTAGAARDLGLFLSQSSDRAGAYRALAEALAIDEKVYGNHSARALEDAADLAGVADAGEAERLWQRASASPDPAIAARSLGFLGEILEAADNRKEAARLYRAALDKEEIAGGKDGARVATRLNALALVSEPAAAIPLLERALRINRKVWGERHPETATTEANLCGELLASGRAADAARLGRLALSNFEATLGPDHPRTAGAASNLADALRATGDRAGAERLYRKALRIDERAFGPRHPETRNDVRNLADFLRESGRAREASALEQSH